MMSTEIPVKKDFSKKKLPKRLPYQIPSILYQGTITTRSGSTFGLTGDPENSGVDPADLFGNGG